MGSGSPSDPRCVPGAMTKAQDRVYQAVLAWFRSSESSPTLRDLSGLLGGMAVSTLSVHVQALETAGRLRRKGAKRVIEVVNSGAVCPTCGQANP